LRNLASDAERTGCAGLEAATAAGVEQEIDEQATSDRAIKADLASPEPWLPERVAKTLRRRKKYR
jgi:hypothetical protein